MNDRLDLRIYTQQLVFPANSYKNLAFLILNDFKEGDVPPKFLIFFDKTKDTEMACRFMHNHLPEKDWGKLK